MKLTTPKLETFISSKNVGLYEQNFTHSLSTMVNLHSLKTLFRSPIKKKGVGGGRNYIAARKIEKVKRASRLNFNPR